MKNWYTYIPIKGLEILFCWKNTIKAYYEIPKYVVTVEIDLQKIFRTIDIQKVQIKIVQQIFIQDNSLKDWTGTNHNQKYITIFTE